MIKRIFILCILLLIAAYLIISATVLNSEPDTRVCKGMELSIKDSIDYGFITTDEIRGILKRNQLLPEGKELSTINVRRIEETLVKHPFIGNAECYLTSGGKVAIDLYQRVPVLRIISNSGDNYYLDSKGDIMVTPGRPVHVVIATGFIDRKFAKEELYPLAKFLQEHAFWKAQIEQINVTPKQELELVPRVGKHILFLGKPGDYNEKFSKLQTFYNEALNKVGWNKYERISIEFTNQIICTKKEK